MDIMAGISAASQAIKMAKEIREVAKDYDSADLKAKIVTLVDSLSDAKLALIEAKEELQSAKTEAEALRAKLSFKTDRTIRRNGLLYEVHEDSKISLHPFCPKCADAGKFFTLRQERDARVLRCPNCTTEFAQSKMIYRESEEVFVSFADRLKSREIPEAQEEPSINRE